MALVKYGGGVVDMRGSIAGTVFSKNSTSQYARARTKPVNPQTDLQEVIRAAMAELVVRWSSNLDATKRAAWELYASNVSMKNRLGESIYLSGFNHYMRSNIPRRQGGLAAIDDGPTVFELPEQDPAFEIAASEGGPSITVTFDDSLAWALETGAYMFKYQGRPQNPQRNFFNGPWQYMDKIAGVDTTGATTPDVEVPVITITELQRQWVYARIGRKDGRLSEPFRADCFVGV